MEPSVIKKLDEVVVNRIAAGEVIQRPANALKEMIENSLDAKATTIQVTVKDSGLKYLQIQDNGTGIRKEDLQIVCERFTTSKLETFDDLSSIKTYGFRGEALASISHVAHLTIQTKTINEKLAYRAQYEDGKLKGDVKICAGNQGTQITVEDLFYNVPQRKQALQDKRKEFQMIYDVMSKYAIHNYHVSFVLKNFGEKNSFRTTSSQSPIDTIRIFHGNQLAQEIMPILYDDDVLRVKIKIYLTKINYSQKKALYIFFINHRLVENSALKDCLESIYSTYLPKGSYPFVYLNLEIDPQYVDVNVHPTKHQVHFLHEDEIIEKIKNIIEKAFVGGNESRKFYTQSKLPGVTETQEMDDTENPNFKKQNSDEKVYSKDLVRTDSKIQKIEKFFDISSSSPHCSQEDKSISQFNIELSSRKVQKQKIETKLSSVIELRKKIENKCHNGLKKALSNLTFVGVIDLHQSLIQCDKILYLCHTQKLLQELFYQLLILNFGNFNSISLNHDKGLFIKELAIIYLNCKDSEWTEADGNKNELAERVTEILIERRGIMSEYFGLNINEDGYLLTLPIILENYSPNLAYLPRYVLRLATEVEWDDEVLCFKSFSQETAYFYSELSYSTSKLENERLTEFVLYPAIRKFLIPPASFAVNKSILQITNLPSLYKVFERC